MFCQQIYADKFRELFKQRAEKAEVENNITDVCSAPWMNVACDMHMGLKTDDWNGDDIREVRRNWLRGILPKQCDSCSVRYSGNLDKIKFSTDPDGFTKLLIEDENGI